MIKVAFQGERGAFSEEAARNIVGRPIKPVACTTFEKVFRLVKSGAVDRGVIPIENSLIGSIHQNYDLLVEHNLKVIAETQLRIVHCLIAPVGVNLKKIRKVYSHPAALEQCRSFFKKHSSKEAIPYYDTAGAVKFLAETNAENSGAIASPYAAEYYKMSIVRQSIEDRKFNFTRFLLLNKKPVRFQGKAKTSIVFSLKNQPGALFKALSVFALRDIDLTKIESRPSRRKAWEYYFYADFWGSTQEERVVNALGHLDEITNFINVLGTYPGTINGN